MSTHFDYMTPAPDATGDPGELSGNSGKLVYESGYTRSSDVPAFDLIEPAFLLRMAEVMSEGELVHGRDNWKKATAEEQHIAVRHLIGHLVKWLMGDRSEPHLAKVGIGAMFLFWHEEIKPSCES